MAVSHFNDTITGDTSEILPSGAGGAERVTGQGRSDGFDYRVQTDSLLSTSIDISIDFNAGASGVKLRVSDAPSRIVAAGAVNELTAAAIGAKLTAHCSHQRGSHRKWVATPPRAPPVPSPTPPQGSSSSCILRLKSQASPERLPPADWPPVEPPVDLYSCQILLSRCPSCVEMGSRALEGAFAREH